VDQLEKELENISPQTIYIGWKTDPYQPCEADLQQTRKVLKLLQRRGFSASILTKSDLILRDLDILRSMDSASVSFSIAFEDDGTRGVFEANTITTEARIAALKQCHKMELGTSAMLCPVIPYVSNVIPLVEKITPYIGKLWVYGLSILDKSEVNWDNVQKILKQYYPDDRERIEDAIFNKDHSYWSGLRRELLDKYEDKAFELSIHF
jgi:DNA repair photolyase